jgi:hypothetical protein
MIVWLASYPRSGNTLLRVILKTRFGASSFDSEITGPEAGQRDYITETMGHMPIEPDWEAFYDRASRSQEPHFVKTHRPPKDDQFCIYIVRDGRKATLSFYHHLRHTFPDERTTLLELVLGNNYYGDWTTHYRQWDPARRRSTLLVKYESLRADPHPEIARIAAFLGFPNPSRPWENPFPRLQSCDGSFFRRGTAEWEPDAEWTPQIEDLFQIRHGDLMRELGYGRLDPAKDFANTTDGYDALMRDLVTLSKRMKQERAQADRDAAMMLAEIERLSCEADKRLSLIVTLSETAHERMAETAGRSVVRFY